MDNRRERIYKYYPDLIDTEKIRSRSVPKWGIGRKNYSDFNAAVSHISSMSSFHNNLISNVPSYIKTCSLFETHVAYSYRMNSGINTKNPEIYGKSVNLSKVDSWYGLVKADPDYHANMTEISTLSRNGDRYPVIKYDSTNKEYKIIQYDDTTGWVDTFDLIWNNKNLMSRKSLNVLTSITKLITSTEDKPYFITKSPNISVRSLTKDGSSISDTSQYIKYYDNRKYYSFLDVDSDGFISETDIDTFNNYIGQDATSFDELQFNILDINGDGIFSSEDLVGLYDYVGEVKRKGWYLVPDENASYVINYVKDRVNFVYNQNGATVHYRSEQCKRIYHEKASDTFFELEGNTVSMYKINTNGEKGNSIDLSPYLIDGYDYAKIKDFDLQDNRLYALIAVDGVSNTEYYISSIDYTTYYRHENELIETATLGQYTNCNLFILPNQEILLYFDDVLYICNPVWLNYYMASSEEFYTLSPFELDDVDYYHTKIWTSLDYYASVYGMERYADETLYEYYGRIDKFINLKQNDFMSVVNLYYELPTNESNIIVMAPIDDVSASDEVQDLTMSIGGNIYDIEVDNNLKLYINSEYCGYIQSGLLVIIDVVSKYYKSARLVPVEVRSLILGYEYSTVYRLRVDNYVPESDTLKFEKEDISYFIGKGNFLQNIIDDIYSSINTYGGIRPYESSYDEFDFARYGNNRIQTEWY